MSNNSGLRTGLYIIITLFLGLFIGFLMNDYIRRNTTMLPRYKDKLTYTMDLLENRYVDVINRDSLAERVMPDLLKKLDPHSDYIPASILQQVNEPLVGQFDGIGVMFNMLTDTALITNVISGGPSDKAGVIAGDKIIKVDDKVVSGIKMHSDSLVRKLRGQKGSKVTISVLRKGSSELTPIEIIRGVIPVKSLDAEFLIDKNVGFIKFSRFASSTYAELMGAMSRLKQAGAKSFVIDLRGNVGGYLDQAIMIANEFLKKGEGIVYTEGAHSPRREQFADGSGEYQNMPLSVIIDEYSASAAEILAGAIQDNDRGLIVGRRSFGKGLVQEQIDYRDGSAARITVAHYYTPVGRSIQKPYKMGESDEYYMELINRAKHKELFNVDSIKQNTNLRYQTPKGKTVYGGGGIMPDEFVPIDTTRIIGTYLRKLVAKNLVFKYAMMVAENNRPLINVIKSFDEMDKFFATKDLYADFIKYAASNGVTVENAANDPDRKFILAQIKGYIGRNTDLEESAYYYYIYPEDTEAIKAVKVLEK